MALAALALSQNIKVHTITFSSQADQVLMRRVATAGGGSYYHTDAATLHAISNSWPRKHSSHASSINNQPSSPPLSFQPVQ